MNNAQRRFQKRKRNEIARFTDGEAKRRCAAGDGSRIPKDCWTVISDFAVDEPSALYALLLCSRAAYAAAHSHEPMLQRLMFNRMPRLHRVPMALHDVSYVRRLRLTGAITCPATGQFSRLQHLEIATTESTGDFLQYLPDLRSLHLSNEKHFAYENLGHLSRLEAFQAVMCRAFKPLELEMLDGVARVSLLDDLIWTDEKLGPLVRATTLELSGCAMITGAGLRAIAAAGCVRTLYLRHCNARDKDFACLGGMLVKLSIVDNKKLTGSCFESFTQLESLSVRCCAGLDEKTLRKALPLTLRELDIGETYLVGSCLPRLLQLRVLRANECLYLRPSVFLQLGSLEVVEAMGSRQLDARVVVPMLPRLRRFLSPFGIGYAAQIGLHPMHPLMRQFVPPDHRVRMHSEGLELTLDWRE